MPNSSRAADIWQLTTALARSGLLAPLRPDRYLRMTRAALRENMSITTGFATAAVRCPDRPAFIDESGSVTWAQLDRECDAAAAALQRQPTGTPDAIGILCRNHRGFVHSLVAATRVGADVTLLNTSFAGPALAQVIERENIGTLFYDSEFEHLVEHCSGAGRTLHRIVADGDDAAGRATLRTLIHQHLGSRPARPHRKGKLVMLTSGTTGTPKGARHSGGGATELRAILTGAPWRAEEATVVAAPMFHAWGLSQLVFSAMMACTIITQRRFDAEKTLALVDRHRATGLGVVPVMLDRITDLPDAVLDQYSLSSLRFVSASGSRMRPQSVVAFMDRFGDIVYNHYNATETGLIGLAAPSDLRAAPTTAGRPVAGTTIRILDDQRRQVATGDIGTIFVRNSSRFDGYTTGGGKDVADGFTSSGDVGYLDDAGRLFVVGRDDEMIVSGGENVYPIEVEQALSEHPNVVEASVVGIDDPEYGERLVAFVVVAEQSATTSELLRDHVRNLLAGYKVPRAVHIVEAIPRNATGKVARAELRERASQEE